MGLAVFWSSVWQVFPESLEEYVIYWMTLMSRQNSLMKVFVWIFFLLGSNRRRKLFFSFPPNTSAAHHSRNSNNWKWKTAFDLVYQSRSLLPQIENRSFKYDIIFNNSILLGKNFCSLMFFYKFWNFIVLSVFR